MSWRILTVHRSTYRYEEPVVASYNEVRLIPHARSGQSVMSAEITVVPTASFYQYQDYFATAVVSFDIPEPHRELVVVCRSVVDTATARPRPTGLMWDELERASVQERFVEYLQSTAFTEWDSELSEIAQRFRNGHSPFEAVEAVSEWVRSTMAYEVGVTGVSTSAIEAWNARRGVCQDFAHLSIVLLRSIGIPTRYVSGYLYPGEEGEIGVGLAGAGHAWIECWVGAWHPVDPTHGGRVGNRYVTTARGRDYADVAPFRGIYQGGALSELDVAIELTRLA